MNESTTTRDLRHGYKIIIILLCVNSITGIAFNPSPFLFSIVMGLGIPGAVFTLYYLFIAFRSKPLMVMLPHPLAILYNIFIYDIFSDQGIHRRITGGTTWPVINIVLSVIALAIAIIAYCKSRSPLENNSFHNFNN